MSCIRDSTTAKGTRPAAQLQLEADDHHHLVGGDDLHDVRVRLHLAEREVDRPHRFPRLAERRHALVEDLLDQPRLDERHRPLRDEHLVVGPAQQPVDDRVDDQRADLQAQLAVQLGGVDQVEARGVGEAGDELGIGKLVGVSHPHLHDRPQEPRQKGAEVAGEPLVESLEGPHLVLADPLRAFEVVVLDLDAVEIAPVAREDLPLVGRLLHLPGRDGAHQGIDVRLIQDVAHGHGWISLPRIKSGTMTYYRSDRRGHLRPGRAFRRPLRPGDTG
jgi:hypothetical protein